MTLSLESYKKVERILGRVEKHSFVVNPCDIYNHPDMLPSGEGGIYLGEAYKRIIIPIEPYIISTKIHKYLEVEDWESFCEFIPFKSGGIEPLAVKKISILFNRDIDIISAIDDTSFIAVFKQIKDFFNQASELNCWVVSD